MSTVRLVLRVGVACFVLLLLYEITHLPDSVVVGDSSRKSEIVPFNPSQRNAPRPPPQTRIIYFLHVHKSGGSSMCSMARSIYNASMPENCNVPTSYWQDGDEWAHYQIGSYFGHTRAKMDSVHEKLVRSKRRFAANEGTVEDADLFPQNAWYTYVVLLRDPVEALLSGYRYGVMSGYNNHPNFKSFLEGDVLGGCINITSPLKGKACSGKASARIFSQKRKKIEDLSIHELETKVALLKAQLVTADAVFEKIRGDTSSSRVQMAEALRNASAEKISLADDWKMHDLQLRRKKLKKGATVHDPTNPSGPRMYYNMLTKRLCGYSCEPANLRDPAMQEKHHHDEMLVKENSDLSTIHVERAKRNLAKFDVVMFLNRFPAGLRKLAVLHPEWTKFSNDFPLHKNEIRKDVGNLFPKSLEEELNEIGVRELVDKITGLDQQLYAWAVKNWS